MALWATDVSMCCQPIVLLVSFLRQRQSGMDAKENASPTKPKIFTIRLFTKKKKLLTLVYIMCPEKLSDLLARQFRGEERKMCFLHRGRML